MLFEEQAAELLRRCEAVAGRRLNQLRRNLGKAGTRADTVFELLVLEAASHVGPVECERPEGGPDVRLRLPSGRWVAIEVTYLRPRFEDEERRWKALIDWMAEEELKLGAPRVAIECHIGGRLAPSGTRITLPAEHEKRQFMRMPEVAAFFAAVRERPTDRHQAKLGNYDVTLLSRPRTSEADKFASSSGPVLESPQAVGEHAAYRALRYKLEQHKTIDEPYIVCIGSDVSRALLSNNFSHLRLQDALRGALRESARLSAVLTVPIRTDSGMDGGIARRAEPTLHRIPDCRHPLTPEEIQALLKLNLSRWKYTFPLSRQEDAPAHRRARVGGSLQTAITGRHTMKLTIPASVLVDVLAGRKGLLDSYGGEDEQVTNWLRQGCRIVACRFIDGDVERAESGKVELEFAPPHEPVYWGESV